MNPSFAEPMITSRSAELAGNRRHTDAGRPKLGFLGVGWIGRNRLEAIAQSELAEIAVIADAEGELASQVVRAVPGAVTAGSLEEMLDMGIAGVVIATPSALHAAQALASLERGTAVFCQKPLGRNADETCRVVDAARQANLLLGVDLSYRYTDGMQKVREVISSGQLGRIYAADLVFHNAYGPDKPWFYDRTLSGGGCVMDLGIHLVDLALWTLGDPLVLDVSSRLFAQGEPILKESNTVEDYATARLDLEGGAVVQIACSWKLPVGSDAVISAAFFGTEGGVSFRNVNGSFYDFVAERFRGTSREMMSAPPDMWGGRAAVDWTRRLAAGAGYSSDIEHVCHIAAVLDAIYEG